MCESVILYESHHGYNLLAMKSVLCYGGFFYSNRKNKYKRYKLGIYLSYKHQLNITIRNNEWLIQNSLLKE